MKPRDLTQLSIHDTLDLDSDGFATLLSGGSSPLSLLSPNSGGGSTKARSPRTGKPATARAPLPTTLPSVGEEEEENEPLGALPQLGSGGRGRGGGGRRPDPRRQSLAISQLFAGLSEGAGLLGESELAVGDEDVQVPLARSGRLLGGAANHSSLFCDPDTGDLLDMELPSPLLPAGDAVHGGAAGHEAAATPAWCSSPIVAEAPRGAMSARRTPAMRASIAVFGDLHKACEEQGLDDFDGDDFQLQESSKVRELAFLFKMDGATPRSSMEAQGPGGTGSGGLRASADLRASRDAALDGIRQRQQQSQPRPSGKPEAAEQRQDRLQSQSAALNAAALQDQQQQAVQPAAAPTPVPASLPQPGARSPAPAQLRSPARAAAHRPASKPAAPSHASAAAAAAGQRGGCRLPAPPARASRLKPPSSSSSFFSSTATASRQTAQAPAAATKAASTAAAASSASGRARPSLGPAGSKAPAAASTRTQAAAAAAAAMSATKAPALSRLATSSSRIPTPSKPEAVGAAQSQRGGMFSQRTLNAAAARQQRTTARAPAPAAAAAIPANSIRGMPGQGPAGAVRAVTSSPATLTPTTARLRMLEQHPELAFGGGTKLAASPACQQDQARKLTAEERHLQDWADHL